MTDLSLISSAPDKVLRIRVPIKIKITIPYLVLSLILAIAAAFLITQLMVENVEERFDKQLFESGKISSELIVGFETHLLESLRLTANIRGVPAAIQAGDAETLRDLTLGVIANDQLERVEFLDLNGVNVLSVSHTVGGNPEEYQFLTGGKSDYSDLDLVKNILARKIDENGDKFVEIVDVDGEKFLFISSPVYDEQRKLSGIVLVGKSLTAMLTEMRAKTFAQITLYDRSGQVLASTLPNPPELSAAGMTETLALRESGSMRRDLEVSNISFSEILGVLEVRGDQELGFLGVALSRGSLVEISEASRWRIFLLVASANFLIILIGINLAERITQPLLQLVRASVKVTEGDLDVKVAPQSNDEVAVLTESFNLMVASLSRSQRQLLKSYDDTLEGWAKALELRDKETEGHSDRVTHMTVRLAEALGIQGEALVNIRRGALLHDIGKMGTPDAILRKAGPLTEEERRVIQKHPVDAYHMLKQIDYLKPALAIPVCHHEKWDGTGYPQGLKGTAIPISARIFSIVDVWDALISDRPYRKGLTNEEAVAYLKDQRGKYFDPAVLDVFLGIISSAPEDVS